MESYRDSFRAQSGLDPIHYGMHVEEGVDGKRLKFLRDVLGARVWRLHRAYRFACSPFMAGFMELKHSERRQLKTAGSVSPRRW